MMRHLRWLLWSSSVLVAALAAAGYAQATPSFDASGGPRVLCFVLIAVFGFAGIFLAPRLSRRATLWCLLVLPALLLRMLLLPVPASDDVNRYIWEGQLVRDGVSPYAHTADAPEWAAYRNSYWDKMNHKDRRTAYPPLAEWSFALTTALGDPVFGFKLWVVLADLLALVGLVALLRRRGLPVLYAGFYAFNPVVLVAFAGEAHFDAFVVAALVWAVWAYDAGYRHGAVALAGVATGLKWVTLPLLPFFARFSYVGPALVLLAVLALPALPFWETLPQLFTGLLDFGGGTSFNGPIYTLLNGFFGWPRELCLFLVATFFGAVVGWRWWLRADSGLDQQIRWVLGALLVCAPTVHFWYLTWILPFVCLRPTMPWVFLSLSSGVYFMVWSRAAEGLGWGLSAGQQFWFWGPFVLGLLYEVWSTRGRCALAPGRATGDAPESIAVVIPTLNAEGHLSAALKSVACQEPPVSEVILVDGGSTDGTRAVAEAAPLPVRLLDCETGRGNQIAKGIEAATAEWVIVLHADARLEPRACEVLLRAVRAMPRVIGGAFGQRFEGQHPELVPIEVLNDLRALFSRTSFGDQVQFFHRSSAVQFDLMPRQPLMEDVESSWRVREQGEFLFLGYPSEVCHRRWHAAEWFRRFALVMRLVSRYRWARLRGRDKVQQLSCELYKEYYK